MRERFVVMGGLGRLVLRLWDGEQLAGARDIGGARGLGEQAIVADAVEALRQHMAFHQARSRLSRCGDSIT